MIELSGDDLDRAIAEQVFGLVRCTGRELRAFHADISEAFKVLQRIRELHPGWRVFLEEWDAPHASMWRCGWIGIPWDPDDNPPFGDGETLPLAICRAALNAVREALCDNQSA